MHGPLRSAIDPIYFNPSHGSYLATTSPHSFRLGGVRWRTAEHYLLAQRYAGTPLAEAIRMAATPNAAHRLVRQAGESGRADWKEVERGLMTAAFLAKFRAHPQLLAALLATGRRTLLQAPLVFLPCQGVVTDNRVGCALMDARATLRRSAAQTAVWPAKKAAGAGTADEAQGAR